MAREPEVSGTRSHCTVTRHWVGTTVVLSCTGDLDMATAHILERHIDAALDQQPSALIVDLSGVDFLASHGMGVLLGTYGCIAGRLDFAVVADGPATSRPMTLLGLGEHFPIYPTLDAALDTLRVDGNG